MDAGTEKQLKEILSLLMDNHKPFGEKNIKVLIERLSELPELIKRLEDVEKNLSDRGTQIDALSKKLDRLT